MCAFVCTNKLSSCVLKGPLCPHTASKQGETMPKRGELHSKEPRPIKWNNVMILPSDYDPDAIFFLFFLPHLPDPLYV
jgi:hypothetical protein